MSIPLPVWLDLSARGKITMTGDDRARLLHAMTTNHIQQLVPGTGCYAYFLSAQGRILADVNVLCRPDSLLLDTEPETRDRIYQHLDQYIIADDVTLEDQTSETATIAVEGSGAARVLESLGAPAPSAEYANQEWGSGLVARLSYTGGPGFFLIVPASEKASLLQKLTEAGAQESSARQFEIARLEQGKPRYGVDLSERFLAQEANQAHAVNFNKGCYLGQEIVERVRSRGQVHRLLVPLEIEGTEVPEAGTKLLEGTANVAEITSSAFSPGMGKVVALAYVRSDKTKPGTAIETQDRTVRVGLRRLPGSFA